MSKTFLTAKTTATNTAIIKFAKSNKIDFNNYSQSPYCHENQSFNHVNMYHLVGFLAVSSPIGVIGRFCGNITL